MTSDQWVLNTIQHGNRLEFTSSPPATRSIRQTKIPADPQKSHALRQEIQQLLSKQAIQRVDPTDVVFTSTFFLTTRKSGEWRPILNLRQVHPSEAVPHGNPRGSHTRITQGLVGGIFRFKRRLPPRFHSQFRQEMTRFLSGEPSLRLQQPPLWSVDCSQNVYQNRQDDNGAPTHEGKVCLRIPRRLAVDSPVKRRASEGGKGDNLATYLLGPDHQREEIKMSSHLSR